MNCTQNQNFTVYSFFNSKPRVLDWRKLKESKLCQKGLTANYGLLMQSNFCMISLHLKVVLFVNMNREIEFQRFGRVYTSQKLYRIFRTYTYLHKRYVRTRNANALMDKVYSGVFLNRHSMLFCCWPANFDFHCSTNLPKWLESILLLWELENVRTHHAVEIM